MRIESIIFVGMAGVGKSSIGKDVANHLKLNFIDTDKLISEDFHLPLNDVINKIGAKKFNELEADYVQKSIKNKGIISPGGSFVYAKKIIPKIKPNVVFIYLFDEPQNIKSRISNLETRGIVGLKQKSFEQLCMERDELYKKVANVQFHLNHFSFEQVTKQIIHYLNDLFDGSL